MYWKEDDDKNEVLNEPDKALDLLFKISCSSLPLDHGYELSQQILKHVPWLENEAMAGIHQIHVAESANGWMRPDDPENDILCVSRRTKMTLRVPVNRLDDIRALTGQTLNIKGHAVKVGDFTTRKLSKLTTIFARYVDTQGKRDENEFLEDMFQLLLDKGIKVKKMMSGLLLAHHSADGEILTRKLMLSDLDVQQSMLLQEQGIGDKKMLGMGIFLPHKGIDAVNKKQEN